MVVRDNENWIEEQFASCELGDRRRTNRLQIIARNMLNCPEKSLPSQNTEWSDLKAAYRFFDNESATFEAVAEPHWRRTRQTKPGRYLFISDTTDVDRFSHQATTGLGMLGDGKGRGVQLHNCIVYNCDEGMVEGSAGALLHYRSRVEKNETRMQRLNRLRESEVWGNLVSAIGAPPEGSQWIHVFDRGGDNFEAMCRLALAGGDWVIRAAKMNRKVINQQGEKQSLRDAIEAATHVGSYELKLRSRQGVKARTAAIDVSAIRVTFPKPQHRSPWLRQCAITELAMNVVIVQESAPPKGVSPVSWILLTSLPAQTFEEAWQVIEDYEHRWLVEEYHKSSKRAATWKDRPCERPSGWSRSSV